MIETKDLEVINKTCEELKSLGYVDTRIDMKNIMDELPDFCITFKKMRTIGPTDLEAFKKISERLECLGYTKPWVSVSETFYRKPHITMSFSKEAALTSSAPMRRITRKEFDDMGQWAKMQFTSNGGIVGDRPTDEGAFIGGDTPQTQGNVSL